MMLSSGCESPQVNHQLAARGIPRVTTSAAVY
jgi:hypothetical protein